MAKYQKLKDTTFINQARYNKNHWDHYFIAIHNFPLDIFENDIITIHEKMLKNKGHYQPTLFALYKAMVTFKSPDIKKQLQKVIDLDSTISFMNEDKKNIHHLLDSLDKQGYVIHKNVFVDDSIQLFDTTYHELVLDSSIISKVEKHISKQQIKESRQITDLKNLLTEINSYSISQHKKTMQMAIQKCDHDYYKDILPSF